MSTGWRYLGLSVIAGLIVLAASANAGAQSQDGADDFRVTLLGTGSPQPVIDRFGPGVLVQVGDQTLLFDCGRGVAQRLFQLRVKLGEANKLFLTHLHSDHTVGIPDLWLTGWLEPPWGQRKGAFQVFGPAGTRNMMENLEKAYEWDIRTRIADQKLAKENVAVSVTEIKEGIVYDHDGVKVTAFEVDHGDLVKLAFGFRVDYGGRSVVISGDTRFNENLIKHATGTDLLIHQVAAVRPELLALPVFQVILAHHTKPEEAGVVFARTKPKLAVFYHFSLLGTPQVKPMTAQEVVELARKSYSGPLLAGEDLMVFHIGREGVAVTK
jgi:ribonuclease Z